MICRPVQRRSGDEREKSERPQEPPENPKAQPPAHGRTVAPHVALEEQPKAGTNDRSHAKLQTHCRHARVKLAQTSDQREEVACRRPASKNHSTKHACKSANEDCAPPEERRHFSFPPQTTAKSQRHAHGHSQKDQIGNELRKLGRASCRE